MMTGKSLIFDLNRRHEFALLFDVTDGNPNGDPDAGNMPRFDPETMQGITTDVMLKRKIRDYVNRTFGEPIFIQSQVALNTLIREAFEEVGVEPCMIDLTEEQLEDDRLIEWLGGKEPLGYAIEGKCLIYSGDKSKKADLSKELTENLENGDAEIKPKLEEIADSLAESLKKKGKASIPNEKREEARKKLCETYFDIRMFGAVLSTGLNAGQVRGPVQLTFARSIDPILPLDLTVTRVARTTLARMAREGTTEMARKPVVPYGLYKAYGFFNPYLAEGTGVKREDLEHLYEALQNLFEFDRSAARGNMAVRGVAVFSHENEKGSAPADRLFKLIRISKRDGIDAPRSSEDYRIVAPPDGSLEMYSFPGVYITWLMKPEDLEVLEPLGT